MEASTVDYMQSHTVSANLPIIITARSSGNACAKAFVSSRSDTIVPVTKRHNREERTPFCGQSLRYLASIDFYSLSLLLHVKDPTD